MRAKKIDRKNDNIGVKIFLENIFNLWSGILKFETGKFPCSSVAIC